MIWSVLNGPNDDTYEEGNDPSVDLKRNLDHIEATDSYKIQLFSTSTSIFSSSMYDLRPAEVPVQRFLELRNVEKSIQGGDVCELFKTKP